MGRSGLVGATTLLLLLLAAFIVLRQAGAGAGMLAAFGAAPPDSAAASTDLDPRVQPFRTPNTRASTDQADRMIRDIEAMGEVYP